MQRKMTLRDFGNLYKEKFEDFEKTQKNPSELKSDALEDYIVYKKQIDLLKQKADLIIDGTKNLSHRNANLKKADELTKQENFSIIGPITRAFAELNANYQEDYSKVKFSTVEKIGAASMSLFGGSALAARQQVAAQKAASLHEQIKDYDQKQTALALKQG